MYVPKIYGKQYIQSSRTTRESGNLFTSQEVGEYCIIAKIYEKLKEFVIIVLKLIDLESRIILNFF